jgi:hypothetical protein
MPQLPINYEEVFHVLRSELDSDTFIGKYFKIPIDDIVKEERPNQSRLNFAIPSADGAIKEAEIAGMTAVQQTILKHYTAPHRCLLRKNRQFSVLPISPPASLATTRQASNLLANEETASSITNSNSIISSTFIPQFEVDAIAECRNDRDGNQRNGIRPILADIFGSLEDRHEELVDEVAFDSIALAPTANSNNSNSAKSTDSSSGTTERTDWQILGKEEMLKKSLLDKQISTVKTDYFGHLLQEEGLLAPSSAHQHSPLAEKEKKLYHFVFSV